jgi:hypothetical protein
MTTWIRSYPGSVLPRRLTPDDVAYLNGALRHAYGVFIDDPATGLEVARTMAASVLHRRGFDADEVLRPYEAPPSAGPEDLRTKLTGLAAALERIAVDGA